MPSKLDQAILTIETSRQTHVDWRGYWESLDCKGECEKCKKFANAGPGDMEHHSKCIIEYDNALVVLRNVKAAVSMLNEAQAKIVSVGMNPDFKDLDLGDSPWLPSTQEDASRLVSQATDLLEE